MRLLWFGTYEADYPRGRVLRQGLRERGYEIHECHVPVWENTRHKAGGFLSPLSMLRTGGRLTAAWAHLARNERRVASVDAVVVGYPAQLDVPLARYVARRRRVPLIIDMMIALSDTLAGDRGRTGRLGRRVLTAIDRQAVRSADLVIADTDANAQWLCTHLGLAPDRVAVVPVGAEPDVFAPQPEPMGEARAVFVGKLAPLHGLATVISAARMPGVPPLTLVGDGQLMPWLEGELQRAAPPRFRHVPWVPYPRLGATLGDHHIALGVFGTSDKAGRVIPNKVWQAMAARRAVVTADTQGVRELLRHEKDALLVPVGDPEALAAAIARLGRDRDLRMRIAEAGHRRYLEQGTPTAVAAAFDAAVQRVG